MNPDVDPGVDPDGGPDVDPDGGPYVDLSRVVHTCDPPIVPMYTGNALRDVDEDGPRSGARGTDIEGRDPERDDRCRTPAHLPMLGAQIMAARRARQFQDPKCMASPTVIRGTPCALLKPCLCRALGGAHQLDAWCWVANK